MAEQTDEFITTARLAARWSVCTKTLERKRMHGLPPQYMKIGGRVLYRMSDIVSFEQSRMFSSTSSKLNAEQ